MPAIHCAPCLPAWPQAMQPMPPGLAQHQIAINTAGSLGTVVTTDMLPPPETLQNGGGM